jgi:hypothetical protein
MSTEKRITPTLGIELTDQTVVILKNSKQLVEQVRNKISKHITSRIPKEYERYFKLKLHGYEKRSFKSVLTDQIIRCITEVRINNRAGASQLADIYDFKKNNLLEFYDLGDKETIEFVNRDFMEIQKLLSFDIEIMGEVRENKFRIKIKIKWDNISF